MKVSDIKHDYTENEGNTGSILFGNKDQRDQNVIDNIDNVAPNRTGVNNNTEDNVWHEANRIVKGWESFPSHHSMRGRTRDIALRIAYIQLTQRRGIIRRDIQNWYGYNLDYARRKIYL